MPPRHYLRRLRNKPTPPIIIPQYYYSNIFQENPTNNDLIQTQLFDIVDMISQRLEITEITTRVNNIVNNLSTSDELFELLNIVETISLSIVQNISDGVDIGIITTRIEYLRKLISDLPEGVQDEYTKIGEIILDVFGMISTGVDFALISEKLNKIKTVTSVYDIVDEIKLLVCSIVQNISDGVDIGIITTRIEYLRNLIQKIPSE